MDRSPPESALAGAGDTYDVVLNLAVPSAYELNFSDLLTDITPERFDRVVQPVLLDTLNQISPQSQRQTIWKFAVRRSHLTTRYFASKRPVYWFRQ